MTGQEFIAAFGGPGKVKDLSSPEVRFMFALAAGDREAATALFENEKQFTGLSAVDCPHGRYEGLAGIGEFVDTWYGWLHAVSGRFEPVSQTIAGRRGVIEGVFFFTKADGSEFTIPMAAVGDHRGRCDKLDELRLYFHGFWVEDYPKYRPPIFPEKRTYETRTEMLSGVMSYYMDLVHNQSMDRIPDTMGEGLVFFGGYGPEDQWKPVTREQMRLDNQEKARLNGPQGPLSQFVQLRMETIIDDGTTCCVEWEQLVTERGRRERSRLSQPGLSIYERDEEGWLKSIRIIDHAMTERFIPWEKTPHDRTKAENINYLPNRSFE